MDINKIKYSKTSIKSGWQKALLVESYNAVKEIELEKQNNYAKIFKKEKEC